MLLYSSSWVREEMWLNTNLCLKNLFGKGIFLHETIALEYWILVFDVVSAGTSCANGIIQITNHILM